MLKSHTENEGKAPSTSILFFDTSKINSEKTGGRECNKVF